MVTDQQVRRLKSLMQKEKTMALAAAKAGMDEKTARKWRDSEKLPSQCAKERDYRTRPDAFAGVWDEMEEFLTENPGLEAKTLFEYLQRKYQGGFQDGQLRTLQRKIKSWRATKGPSREVFFPQVHTPGKLSQSDFTHMGPLGITIAGEPFDHLLYHFTLTCSNWETGGICFSESFEALSRGLQNALWELGGVPEGHRTDRMTTAVAKPESPEEFTCRYQALLDHYGMGGRKIQTGRPNENGDVEQSHHRFKRAVDQSLMLRGSRDFTSRAAYEAFLRTLFRQRNSGRGERLSEELAALGRLPAKRAEDFTRVKAGVGKSSTIRVKSNSYSVPARMIGEEVEVRVYAEHLEVLYGQRKVETIPRLRGKNGHLVQYRHVIDWLVRKPGAFADYRYRTDMFPSTRFRAAYDSLAQSSPARADREYLKILKLAADEGQARVDEALRLLLDCNDEISAAMITEILSWGLEEELRSDVFVTPADLGLYDLLLKGAGVS
jgi:hypothetical protein